MHCSHSYTALIHTVHSLSPHTPNCHFLNTHANTGESAAPGRRGLESVLCGERVIESLELVQSEGAAAAAAAKERRRAIRKGMTVPPPAARSSKNPLLLGLAPDDHFLRELLRVKAAELEQTLLVLPLSQVRLLCSCSVLYTYCK
jgi:hypothetical protein